ncbi:MAG: hypothetical protein JXR37_21470 [Kiritimatiellae bacterium]|nr:hypothetical protein [Kiritimatiellia bacterium]
MKHLAICLAVLAAALPARAGAPDLPPQARAELRRLQAVCPRFRVVPLPRAGELALDTRQSLTVEDLRGVRLDDAPPRMSAAPSAYEPNMRDDLGAGAPYVARGIAPFRLKHFTCEFSYGGWRNHQMFEYALTHGFSVLAPYQLSHERKQRFPPGTVWLQWGCFLQWKDFFRKHDIPWGRWDRLAESDALAKILESNPAWKAQSNAICMIDIEQASALPPGELRKQAWYPNDASEEARQTFERTYYLGFARHHTFLVEAARRAGWTSIGVYPQLFQRGWWEMINNPVEEKDPARDWQWSMLGIHTAPAQDVLYPDNYVFYWDARNVGYVLAHQDYLHRCVNTLRAENRRPIRPYLWPLLHGGSADYHWWNQMPLPVEDQRALFLFSLFLGNDGVVLWNWSGTGNHHRPRPLVRAKASTAHGATGAEQWPEIMVGREFSLRARGASRPTLFKRYDVVAVTEIDERGQVSFQRFATAGGNPNRHKRDPEQPVFTMPKDRLEPLLRAESEAVAGAIEGLALAKPLEYILRHGEPRRDPRAVERFVKGMPLVRHVKLGPLHVLATYDPNAVYGTRPKDEKTPPPNGRPREIVLENFDGVAGRALRLPADAQTRVFVLGEP